MGRKTQDAERPAWFEPAPVESYPSAGLGRIKTFEARLPVLQGLSEAQRDALAEQARPGESWEQLVERLEGERRVAFLSGLKACRLCQTVEHYRTEACKQMGICDRCNASLEAEMQGE